MGYVWVITSYFLNSIIQEESYLKCYQYFQDCTGRKTWKDTASKSVQVQATSAHCVPTFACGKAHGGESFFYISILVFFLTDHLFNELRDAVTVTKAVENQDRINLVGELHLAGKISLFGPFQFHTWWDYCTGQVCFHTKVPCKNHKARWISSKCTDRTSHYWCISPETESSSFTGPVYKSIRENQFCRTHSSSTFLSSLFHSELGKIQRSKQTKEIENVRNMDARCMCLSIHVTSLFATIERTQQLHSSRWKKINERRRVVELHASAKPSFTISKGCEIRKYSTGWLPEWVLCKRTWVCSHVLSRVFFFLPLLNCEFNYNVIQLLSEATVNRDKAVYKAL